jgi:hypothetical protein
MLKVTPIAATIVCLHRVINKDLAMLMISL